MSKLLLLLGPPGAGKTTIIRRLTELDSRFTYVRPVTTRALRVGEVDKIQVTPAEMDRLLETGQVLWINALYGARYGTPRQALFDALQAAGRPVIDWPATEVSKARDLLGRERVVTIYLAPPSIGLLEARLRARGEFDPGRLRAAQQELECLRRGEFDDVVDRVLVTNEGGEDLSARKALELYEELTDGL